METGNIHPGLKFMAIGTAALGATGLCFYLMMFLIANEMTDVAEIEVSPPITPALAEHKPVESVSTRKKPTQMLPVERPPSPNVDNVSESEWIQVTAEKPVFGSIADLLGPSDIQLQLEAPHSDLLPLYVVRPVYPLSAAMKEIEGYVLVKFRVKENGTVANPQVIKSEPGIMFNEAAVNALLRFKFKPREVGGEQISTDNVQMKFSFNLDSLYDVPAEVKQ